MNKLPRIIALTTASGLALLAAGQASAQSVAVANAPQAASSNEDTLGAGEIVVTAQKREQRLNDVGMSITAIAGDELVARGITDATDLGKVVLGFTYSPSGLTAPVYTIRGVGFYETTLAVSPAVTVYTDEVSLPYPVMTNLAGLDVERVEVLKGPQGTVFGQNSTGGAINFVAAKPTDYFTAGMDVSYGRFNDIKLGGFVSGPLSDTLKIRIAGRAESADGWQKSFTRNETNGKISYAQGRILAEWEPTDAIKITANVNGWIDKSDPQVGQAIDISPNLASFPDFALSNPLPPRKLRLADWVPGLPRRNNNFYQMALRADIMLNDEITLTSNSAFSHFKLDETQDFDATRLSDSDLDMNGKISAFSQELRLSGQHDRLNWLLGASYSHDRIYDQQTLLLGIGVTVFPGLEYFDAQNFSRQKVESKAAFGNVEYEITDSLTLQAGGRYTETIRDFAGCISGPTNYARTFEELQKLITGGSFFPVQAGDCVTLDPNNGFKPGLVQSRLSEDNVSWRLGVNWKVTPTSLLYANVSKGYKAGSAPTLSSGANADQYKPIKQESLLAYEAGFKVGLLDRRVQLNGAVFYYDYRDKQLRSKLRDPVFGPLDTLVNIPKSRLWGAEIELTAQPVDGWDFKIGGTYLNSRIQTGDANCAAMPTPAACYFTSPGDVQKVIDGNPYPYTPKLQVLADNQYEWALSTTRNAFIGSSINFTSHSTSSIGNEPLYRNNSHAVIDVRLGIADPDGRWRATLWGRNITNEYYWNSVIKGFNTSYRFVARPATYGISLNVKI